MAPIIEDSSRNPNNVFYNVFSALKARLCKPTAQKRLKDYMADMEAQMKATHKSSDDANLYHENAERGIELLAKHPVPDDISLSPTELRAHLNKLKQQTVQTGHVGSLRTTRLYDRHRMALERV